MNVVTMTTFTIDNDNNIKAFTERPVTTDPAHSFSTEKELANLTGDWPASRLIETWNSFAGIAPFDDLKAVKKFTDRKSAVLRIWKAVQRLTPSPAAQAARVATKEARSRKGSTDGVHLVNLRSSGTGARESKRADVLALLGRSKGATLADIMKATGWQAHTVRGFISIAAKKNRINIESSKNEAGERTYRMVK